MEYAVRTELRTYWVMACVELHRELPAPEGDDDRRPDVGYYRNFGVTTSTEVEVCSLVEAEVADGDIAWSKSEISVDVVNRLNPDIIARAGDWTQQGIWYRSGRVFFPGD